MAYCKKCGAYIPIGENACPACGYDPEAEARAEQKAAERARREAARKAEQERARVAQEKKREEEEHRREEEERRTRQHSYGGSAAREQYASRQQTRNWIPPWSQEQFGGRRRTGPDPYADMQRRARESVDNQKLSVLSYLGILLFIPMILRKDDPFARFHTNQGLVLFLVSGILNMLFMDGLLGLAVVGFDLYCIVKGIQNVLRGKMEPLPLIGGIRLIK